MNIDNTSDTPAASDEKFDWVSPEMSELDVLETANGSGGSDGMGGGSQTGGNQSGS